MPRPKLLRSALGATPHALAANRAQLASSRGARQLHQQHQLHHFKKVNKFKNMITSLGMIKYA